MRSCTKKSCGDGLFPWISFSLGHQKSDNIWNLRGLLSKRSSSVNLTLRKWSIRVDGHTFLPANPTRFRKMVGKVTHAKARNKDSPTFMTPHTPMPHDPRFQFAVVMVRDQDRSLRFYVDELGFRLVADQTVPHGGRWVV